MQDITPTNISRYAYKYQIDKTVNEITNELPDVWMTSSILGANKLYSKFFKVNGTFTFHKGSPLVDTINSLFQAFKKNEGLSLNINKWNPADFWLVSEDFDINVLSDEKTMEGFNQQIQKQLLANKLIGISLKQMAGNATLTINNVDRTKKYDKILERIGRIKEKYSKVASRFDIKITADDKKEKAIAIAWEDIAEKQSKTPGIYCIRTNQTELNNQQIWNTYRMLNDIEEAFRTLKTDLGLRPIYHQKTNRISGHIFISVLAYHILHSVRYQLKLSNINDSWQTIMSKLSTHYRITTSIQQKHDKLRMMR